LKWLIEKIDPKAVIPVHTEHGAIFKKLVKTKIIHPKYGKTMEIK
jgi:mRNA degradation ribonuclease J1/J2